MFDIKEELKKVPMKPGVYLMKDSSDIIIYVGKAIKLRNRVRQYFQSSSNKTPKIQKMVQHIHSFEYIVTDSELEALILECNLIKKHRPKYNSMLKDDKMYPYIKVTVYEAFPRVLITRTLKKDKAKYYGPYTNAYAAKETIEVIRNIWHIRTCNRRLPRDTGKERPCLYYHIKQCDGVCTGQISSEAYKENISEVIDFLNGNREKVINILTERMQAFSEEMEFEKAGAIRDQLKSIDIITQKQKIINAAADDQDIIAFARGIDEALFQVYFIRNGKMIGREHFHLSGVDDLSRNEVMTNFIKQFYSGTPFIPKEIILQEEIDEATIINAWLSDKRGHKVYIKVPRKGEKSRLVELAEKNAMMTLEQFGEEIKRKERKTKGAIAELIQIVGLEEDVKRVEAYDISNTSGFESVGSMVVFENGQPKRSDYRKFKIKGVKGPNDYASLEEVLTRRFKRALKEQEEILKKGLSHDYGKFTKLPDLILMDGGKGQVNIAVGVLEQLGLEIPVCGMVKDEHHQTRGLFYQGIELPINPRTEAFKIVARIQDEAHRFAIEYHRKLRSNKQVHSVLDDIKGIGPTRRKKLLQHFGSIEKIKEASIEKLMEVDAMNTRSANAVYMFFHQ